MVERSAQRQRLYVVETAEVAEALTDPDEWKILAAFMHAPKTLSEAADFTGMKLPALSYRVNKLLGLGLLHLDEAERAGRLLKTYQSSAEHYFVPFALSSSETLADLLDMLTQPSRERAISGLAQSLWELADRRALTAETLGLNIFSHAEHDLTLNIGRQGETIEDTLLERADDDMPALRMTDTILELDFATAKALQRDLDDLYQRYRSEEKTGQQRYLLRLGLIPLQD